MLPLSDLVTSMYCLDSFTGQTFAFSQTRNFISPTWSLLPTVFNLSPIRITRKFYSIVVFRMFITDKISLPCWPYNFANNEAYLREISSKDFLNIELKYFTTALACQAIDYFCREVLLLLKPFAIIRTSIPSGVYLHHIFQLWQIKTAYLWHYWEHYNLNFVSEVHVKIQEQLLKWDASDHTSFQKKTVAIVFYICHIYIYCLISMTVYCLCNFIWNTFTFVQFPETRHNIKASFGKVGVAFLLYGKYKNLLDFSINECSFISSLEVVWTKTWL